MNIKDMNQEQRKEWVAAQREIRRKERELLEVETWKNLKPFNDGGFVPELPRPLTPYHEKRLIDCGAIPKDKLQNGVWYFGDYRNAKYGRWDANKEKFLHRNYTMGRFVWDECNHFQDDDLFALFVPLREAMPEEIEKELNKK